jgi:hypothetical protein
MRHRLVVVVAVAVAVAVATLVFWPSSSVEISGNLIDLESNETNTLESKIEEVAPSESSVDDNLEKSSEVKKVKDKPIKVNNDSKEKTEKSSEVKKVKDKPIKVNNDSKEKTEKNKVISFEKNQYGSGDWADFTGYNDDNIVNVYVAGKDIAPGVYWTGVKDDPCYGSVVTTAEGQRYTNLEHGEQSVFHLEKGDSLTTRCNWYQGNMPNYKVESPTGMILASQLGVGEFKVKSTGSCVIMRDYLDNFVNAKTVFVFEEGSNFIFKITKEDIEKNTVIGLIDRCGGLVRIP